MTTIPFSGAKDRSVDMALDALPDDAHWRAASKAIDYRRSVDDKPLRLDAGYREMLAVVDRPLPQVSRVLRADSLF